MEFSNTTSKDGIIQNCESKCKLGDGGISGNAILLAKFTGYINQAWEKVAMRILQVDKNWRWDDNNYWNQASNAIPVATHDLEDGERMYILPRSTNSADQSTTWKVYKVRVKDINGVFYDLLPLGADEDETSNGSGKPTHYRLVGNNIRLSDPPSSTGVTLTGGIQVWFQRAFIKFTSSDTTKQPGFISSFHHLLELDASATHLLPTDKALAADYITLFNAGLDQLEIAFAQRNDDPKNTKRLIPHIESNK